MQSKASVLNRDVRWTRHSEQDDAQHQEKAKYIVNTVLQRLDLNNDGQVTPEELEKVGLAGLPNFNDLGAEGHHYDVESGESKPI